MTFTEEALSSAQLTYLQDFFKLNGIPLNHEKGFDTYAALMRNCGVEPNYPNHSSFMECRSSFKLVLFSIFCDGTTEREFTSSQIDMRIKLIKTYKFPSMEHLL